MVVFIIQSIALRKVLEIVVSLFLIFYFYFRKAKEITCRYTLRTFVPVRNASYSICICVCSFVCLFLCYFFCPSFLSFSFFCSFTSPQCNPAAHYPQPPSLSQPCPISFFFLELRYVFFFLISAKTHWRSHNTLKQMAAKGELNADLYLDLFSNLTTGENWS